MLQIYAFLWFHMISGCSLHNLAIKAYVQNIKSHMQFMGKCMPWKITSSVENAVLQALQFHETVVCCKLPRGAGISQYKPNEHFVEVNLMLMLNCRLL
jgi:hypothetical protein